MNYECGVRLRQTSSVPHLGAALNPVIKVLLLLLLRARSGLSKISQCVCVSVCARGSPGCEKKLVTVVEEDGEDQDRNLQEVRVAPL